LGIDSAKIDSCVNADSLSLLKLDEQAAGAYGVSGSPSLMINGAKYNGARSSEDYKSAICSAFNNPPAECEQGIGAVSQPVDEAPHEGCG
jgi:predicted DsbA family dithiol-disulfide isomerase